MKTPKEENTPLQVGGVNESRVKEEKKFDRYDFTLKLSLFVLGLILGATIILLVT